jgi:hypothetical protein
MVDTTALDGRTGWSGIVSRDDRAIADESLAGAVLRGVVE